MKTAWAFWDFGSAAFNAVLVTFIFSVYLTDSVGSQINAGQTPSFYYSIALAVAGAAIALVAPMMGQRADAHGTRRRSLVCLLYTSPSPRDKRQSRMPSSA